MSDIREIFDAAHIALTQEQEERFGIYRTFLLEYNEKVNLTAITDPQEVVRKHFLDSVLGEKFIPQGARVLDVGTGAGFPSVPLKILRPDLSFILLDSLQKRIVFLEELMKRLQLTDMTCIHARAEEGVKTYREQVDVAVARAVAPLPTLLEYVLPYVKVGGRFVAYKADVAEEILAAKRALSVLGGKIGTQEEFLLPNGEKRTVVVVEKISPTPVRYPRQQNKPRISPL